MQFVIEQIMNLIYMDSRTFQIERPKYSVLSVTRYCVYFYVPTSLTAHCYVTQQTTVHISVLLLFAV